MEKHKLDELRELLDKYELQKSVKGDKIRAVDIQTKKEVKLETEKMRNLIFAHSWARAWIEAGCYDYDVPVEKRKIPGFDLEGKNLYDALISEMKDWAHRKDFHYFIDYYKMSDRVQKHSDNPYASRIVFQLLRPDRLDSKPEFHELYETGKITTDLVNKDEMLHKMYKYLLNEAEYTSLKGFQPGE